MAAIAFSGRVPAVCSRLMLCTLAAALLLSGFTGRAGVQVLGRDHAARLFPLHLHGIPGERDYVQQNQRPAPFVAGHCHALYENGDPPPAPHEVQSASTLAGSVLCMAALPLPAAPPALTVSLSDDALRLDAASLTPLLPPPRA